MEKYKYTVKNSPSLAKRIESDLQQIVQQIVGILGDKNVQNIVLVGGYGRGEGTPYTDQTIERPFNDYDIIVVSPTRSARQLAQLHALKQSLASIIGLPVDLHLHTAKTLAKAAPSLLNVEMQLGHQVIWGEGDPFNAMPPYTLADIPLEEGTRLLMNRGRLLLKVGEKLANKNPLSQEEAIELRKFLFKAFLAMGDCTLLAASKYDIYYQNKCKLIEPALYALNPQAKEWILEGYLQAAYFKLEGEASRLLNLPLENTFYRMQKIYPAFFLWYESKRLHFPLQTIEDYVTRLGKEREIPTKAAKALLLNAWFLKRAMWKPKAHFALLYPRKRIYAALLYLLQEPTNPQLQQLLGVQGSYEQLLARFKTLSHRFQ